VADDRFLTFQVLANLLSRHHFHVFLAMDPGPLAPYYDLFDRCLGEHCPAMARHLASCNVPCEMYLFGWLQTVFLKALPLSVAARVWDAFLLDGVPRLFRTALAILDLLAPVLLDSAGGGGGASFEVVVNVLTRARSALPAWERLVTGAGAAPDGAALFRAVDAVQLPAEALLELEDLSSDAFFYRHVSMG
jgi:hypothetical protein